MRPCDRRGRGLTVLASWGLPGGTGESTEMDHTLLQSCGSHLNSGCRTTLQCSKCVRNAYVVYATPGRMPDFRGHLTMGIGIHEVSVGLMLSTILI
ncbi:hypothetical protein M0804_002030 [Polistes exclamans]|nr:hypothetical protein M0804_002030 [Polistes exclamans]